MAKKVQSQKEGQNAQQSNVENIFYLVKDKDGKIVITCAGQAVSSRKFDTFKQADFYISTKPYELLINTAVIAVKLSKNIEENENKNENPQDK